MLSTAAAGVNGWPTSKRQSSGGGAFAKCSSVFPADIATPARLSVSGRDDQLRQAALIVYRLYHLYYCW